MVVAKARRSKRRARVMGFMLFLGGYS